MGSFLLLGLLALQAPTAPPRDAAPRPAETYTIRGRVTDVTSGQPIRGVAISIYPASEGPEGFAQGAFTDDEGQWSFSGLPTGDYILNHSKAGFTRVPGVRIYSPVHVSKQFPVRDLDLVLMRGGVITGRLTDHLGEPAVGVHVQAQRVVQGQPTWSAHQDTTDDRGEFRVFGLASGEYVLSAMPQGRHEMPVRIAGEQSPVVTYYPGAVSMADAERLVIAEQTELTDLTFQLQTARTFVVSGEVITTSREVDHISVSLNEETPGFSSSRGSSFDRFSRGRGRFTIRDVLPGNYTVSAEVRLDDGEEHGEVPVVVGDEDVTVTIVTQGPTVVRGRVVTSSGPLRDLDGMQIGVSSLRPQRRPHGRPGRVREDGTFELTTTATTFRVHVFSRTAPTGWRLKEVRWRGERVGKDGISASGPVVDGVEVVVADSTARLQGTARDATGAAMREGTVVIVPAEDGAEGFPMWYRAVITEGRFVSPPVPEGRYLVAAVAAVATGQITPDIVAQVRERGESIELGDRELRTLALSVVVDVPR